MSTGAPRLEVVEFAYQEVLGIGAQATVGEATLALHAQVDELMDHPFENKPRSQPIFIDGRPWPLIHSQELTGSTEATFIDLHGLTVEAAPRQDAHTLGSLKLLTYRESEPDGSLTGSWPAGTEAIKITDPIDWVRFSTQRLLDLEGQKPFVEAFVRPLDDPEASGYESGLHIGKVRIEDTIILEEVADDPEYDVQVFLEACKGVVEAVHEIQRRSQPA